MTSTTMKAGWHPAAQVLARAVMLLFCVALAAAVGFEWLRQYLHARYANASAARAAARQAKVAREAVGLALTMDHRVA
jgi:uncharacterized membrane protein SpoIIM required for sporulation